MVNPTYCTKALRRGNCTDSSCPMRHDISRCELCNCSFPHASLSEHQSGKQHLRNVASTGPQQPPPSQMTSNIRSAPPANIPQPVGVDIPTFDTDPRVNVSGEGGLYFSVEGSGTPGIPLFSPTNRNILIKKTNLRSGLSLQSVTLTPPLGSCFAATLIGKETTIQKNMAREIIVSFHPPRVGSFHAVLKITFSDKGRNDKEFTVTRELRGDAILPGGLAISGDVVGVEEGGGTGITVSHESGLEFLVERSDGLFLMQKRELVITKTSDTPAVFFRAAKVSSLHDSVASWFSVRLEGDSKWVKQSRERKVAVCFMPEREGRCEAVLELTFWDHERTADFVIRRTLSGQAKERAVRQGLLQIECAPNTAPRPINDRVDDPRTLVDEESLNCDGTGISVSHVDGLNFGIVERKCPNGPFETPSAMLDIKLEGDFPPVTFVEGRAKGGDREFRAVVDSGRDSLIVRPGSGCRVRVIFSPKYEGLFKATLELIFHHTRLSVYFVIRRALQGIAGSLKDHKHFESLGQEDDSRTMKSREPTPPRRETILLFSPDQRRRSRHLPTYELPPIIQEALDRSTVTHPYEEGAPGLISALRPDGLNISTYAHYFNALLAVNDGHLQWDVMCRPTYDVDVQGCGGLRYSIEIENNDEDLLPEVSLGDFLWLDDVQDDIRYEARVTDVDVFTRHHLAVLKVSLRLPPDFGLYNEAQFEVRFRLNRIALRRQYHALTAAVAPPRRLLFPSLSDIRPTRRHSRPEINNPKFRQLVNRDIRDDGQQLQAVISILGQPPGSVPFVIYGPPGTGKTSIIVESVVQLVRRDAGVRVLVCTPSNAAADLLAERLAEAAGLDSDKLYRLDASSVHEEDIYRDVQAMSLFPGHERLLAFRVILSTCSSASMLRALDVPVGHFSHIVIDEAGQAEEPLAMIPIMGFSDAYTNIILAGDPNQLRPIIKSPTAARAGLGKSYLERLMLMDDVYGLDTQTGKTIVALHRNHRSHGSIIAWSNRYFYEDVMRDYGNSYITNHLVLSDVLPKKGFPVVFHGVKGNEQHTKWSPSYFNIIEATIVRDYCVKLIGDRERKIYQEEIGVLAPYGTQVRAIRELLRVANLSDISVGPVEQFQGQERKVIILATTRSNEESHPGRGLGFLINRHRTNVAITRAQALLIVIGDPEVLRKDKLWRIFLNYIESRKGWAGKVQSWKPDEAVHLPEYDIVTGIGGIMYGEEFIGGKSQKIRRSAEGTGG